MPLYTTMGRAPERSAMSNNADDDRNKSSRRLRIGIPAAAIVLVLVVTLVVVKPAMPKRIELLTGPDGSAYHEFGKHYADELRKHGLEAEVVVTAGALDNLRRLAERGEDAVAFVSAALGQRSDENFDTSDLVSFGNVGLEPLWLFLREELDIGKIPDLAGLEVAAGGRGTLSDDVGRKLIEHTGLGGRVKLGSLGEEGAASVAEALVSGDLDAAFLTGAPGSPVVRSLLDADGVTFLSFDRAEAYAALIPGITALKAPQGIFDLARDIPAEDAWLLSSSTEIVAPNGIHPAIAPMVLSVASVVRERNPLATPITFPNQKNLGFPLEPSAKRYFERGETGLSKYLPYGVTRYLNHLGFVVLPLLTLVVVLLKIVPLGLKIWCRMRLAGLLKQLEAVEKADAAGGDPAKELADLDRVDRASAKMFVPRSVVHDYIDFRQFLHDMRERIEQRGSDRS